MPNTPKLNQSSIDEFNDLHEKTYGFRLTNEDARTAAMNLVSLILKISST